jgi:CheY-like chemotaxis protein
MARCFAGALAVRLTGRKVSSKKEKLISGKGPGDHSRYESLLPANRGAEGACSAHRLGLMRLRPRTPDREEIVTLELEVSPELAGPAQRVLLLEDRDDFREVLRDHLTSRLFQVTSVPSGVEGLREIRKEPFDLIICDMMMPKIGGEMFYWAVTRMRPATAQRFIFFTGHRNRPEIEFFFNRVKATVLIKPFKLTELDTTIREVLRKLV